MTQKQAIGIIIAITIAFVALVTTQSMANETQKQETTLQVKIQNYVERTWHETVEYQKKGWEEGKQQMAQNKQQISNLFQNIADGLGKLTGTNESSN